MTILVKKVFISSKPTFVYLLCPPLCGPFSIQESAAGGLSYKAKKRQGICCTCLAFYGFVARAKSSCVSIFTEIMNLISVECWILLRGSNNRKLTCFQFYCRSIFVLNRIRNVLPHIVSNGWIIIIFPGCLIICHQHRVVTSEVRFVRCNLRFMQL